MADPNNPYETTNDADDIFLAPPTDRDEDIELADPPKWPKVVGIISIILGTLGVICTGGGTAMAGLSAKMIQSSGMQGPFPPAITNPPMIVYISGALSVLLSIYLIVTGVITANRKPIGRIMHVIYAILAIIIITVALKYTFDQQAVMAQWVKDHPDAPFAKTQSGAGGSIGLVIGIFMSFLRYIWPTFCLIWFGLIKTKAKHMTGAGLAPAA